MDTKIILEILRQIYGPDYDPVAEEIDRLHQKYNSHGYLTEYFKNYEHTSWFRSELENGYSEKWAYLTHHREKFNECFKDRSGVGFTKYIARLKKQLKYEIYKRRITRS